MSRTGRYEFFMNELLLECKQTRLYQLTQEKNLQELKKMDADDFYFAMFRKVDYQVGRNTLKRNIVRSLIFAFAYQGNEDLVVFLYSHARGEISEAIRGFAEGGKHEEVNDFLKRYPHEMGAAMLGYATSCRIQDLANLIMLGGDVSPVINRFISREIPDESFQKTEVIRLLMFIDSDDLRLQVIHKLKLHEYYSSYKYYDKKDLDFMLIEAKNIRIILETLFLSLAQGILIKEVVWLVASYLTTLIEPEECSTFVHHITSLQAACSAPTTRFPLLSWLRDCCKSSPCNQKPQRTMGCIIG